jgi:hypothetical protein
MLKASLSSSILSKCYKTFFFIRRRISGRARRPSQASPYSLTALRAEHLKGRYDNPHKDNSITAFNATIIKHDTLHTGTWYRVLICLLSIMLSATNNPFMLSVIMSSVVAPLTGVPRLTRYNTSQLISSVNWWWTKKSFITLAPAYSISFVLFFFVNLDSLALKASVLSLASITYLGEVRILPELTNS